MEKKDIESLVFVLVLVVIEGVVIVLRFMGVILLIIKDLDLFK